MQALPRWRSLLIFKNSVIQSTIFASTSKAHLAAFHSTRVTHEKWRSKWGSDDKKSIHDERSNQMPSKDYITYKSRQKRADTKKALKNLLFNSGFSNVSSKETYSEIKTWSDVDEAELQTKKDRSKSSYAARRAAKADHKRMKCRLRKEKTRQRLNLEDVDQDNLFQESVSRRGCTWSYWSFRGTFYQAEFDFNKRSSKKYRRHRESDTESEAEPNKTEPRVYWKPCGDGKTSERQILGLPKHGPLNFEDVKKAYYVAVRKWHPDKYQGSSEAVAIATEKFRRCVDAYESLCASLPTAAA